MTLALISAGGHETQKREAWEKAQVLWGFENDVPDPARRAAVPRVEGQTPASWEAPRPANLSLPGRVLPVVTFPKQATVPFFSCCFK